MRNGNFFNIRLTKTYPFRTIPRNENSSWMDKENIKFLTLNIFIEFFSSLLIFAK